jgi:hypothetical protein
MVEDEQNDTESKMNEIFEVFSLKFENDFSRKKIASVVFVIFLPFHRYKNTFNVQDIQNDD